MSDDDLRAAMKRRFTAISMTEWCAVKGCNKGHVSEFLAGRRGPPNDLLAALNLEVRYVRKRRAE